MRPPPTTAEYIASHAASDPRRLALQEDGTGLDYAQLHGIVAQCATRLQALGVRPGERVAVSGPGFGIQLVLLLAAEGLGAVTVSFQAEDDPEADWLFARVHHVFSCRPQEVPAGVRFHRVDDAFAAALAQPWHGSDPAWSPLPLEAPQRITRTSGSSGRAKFMQLARAAQEWQIRCAIETRGWEMGAGTRLLVLSPLVVNAGFARISGCLRRGGAVLSGPASELRAMDPTHVIGLPAQLERLLRQLPAGYAAPRRVALATFGGAPAAALREQARAVFGSEVANRYGSNEAGVICDGLDASGAGVLLPGVDARILDAQGRDLPPGAEGIVALRTPAVVDGYLERPEESAAAFRDGWFVSGDVGTLLAPRVLRLAGRHDDLVNVGGLKLPAAQVEQELRAHPAIDDAAVLAVHVEGASLGVAVVPAAGATLEELQGAVAGVLQLGSDTAARLLVLDAIPRMPTGKTDRMRLMQMMRGAGVR